MAEKRVVLKRDGGAPEVEITIVTGHTGEYQLLLWNPEANRSTHVAKGNNFNAGEHKHVVGEDVGALDQHVLQWTIALGAMDDASTDRYEVRVRITQGGQPVEGGDSSYTGSFVGDETLLGNRVLRGDARLIVQS